jgi:hypothetical protein
LNRKVAVRYTPSLVAALIVGVAPPTMRPPASLSGRVVAAHTGTPLPDATVRVDGVSREARTDSAGAFVLAGVPGGTVTVRARRIGFYAGLGTVRVDSASPIEVGLDPVLTCLDACVTQPSPTPGYVRLLR